jgi:hypothetical protein
MKKRRAALGRDAHRFRLAPAMIALAALAGCGGDEPDPVAPPAGRPDPPRAAAISISPNSVTLTSVGETATLTANVTDQFGAAFSGTVVWTSTDAGVFTVNSSGIVTAVGSGSGTVTAAISSFTATASVTVDINLPPMVRPGVPTGITVELGARGGTRPWLAATRFEDPDDDVLDLTYTVEVEDTTVAWAEVWLDTEGNPSVVMGGRAEGRTGLTATATDPGGLSASASIILDVVDSDFSPASALSIGNGRIEIPAGALLEGCTPPLVNLPDASGYIFTFHSSRWQTRSDPAAAWSDVEGTEVTDGTLCVHATQTPGEYRLVADITLVLGENLEPLRGWYRSSNTFIVEEHMGGNRAPELSATAPQRLALSVGGGSQLVAIAQHLSDPDGDDLAFSVEVSDTTMISVREVTDGAGNTVVVATGLSEGSGTITITATDPGGLAAELSIAIQIDDSGYTSYHTIQVANGLVVAAGFQSPVCTPPFIGLRGPDGWIYTIHSAKWQSRSDMSGQWADIEGTAVTTGVLCPHTTTTPGDYRLVYDATIAVSADEAFRGNYASQNYFTVASGG